ncbi:hypothetical protein [Streptomyces sp. 6N223]|uniref:hypothetical protein n=1 Tax=Streptomyces sp. 6N223 TaxID=3457412 RepID=UPI003FD0BBEA
MTATDPDKEDRREQHNYGPGTFIGGDNYGSVEMLDASTKALLAKMTKQAPALAKLLGKALRDGVISPDAARALLIATRNINEDVAHSLTLAARNINEDVAHSLAITSQSINTNVAETLRAASDDINPAVADSISEAARELTAAMRGFHLDDVQNVVTRYESASGVASGAFKKLDRLHNLSSLADRLEGLVGSLASAAKRIEKTITPPPPEIIIDWKKTWYAFLLGVVVGLVAFSYLAGR